MYKGRLFIGLIHENVQLHYFHVFSGAKKKNELNPMSTPNFPPLLSSLTSAESGLYLQGFQILDLDSLTQSPANLAPFPQTYLQDAGFHSSFVCLHTLPSSF